MKKAGNREDFIREMWRRGYDVRWEDARKSITYTTPTGIKCRDDKLHERKFRKGKIEDEFRIRRRAAQQRLRQIELATKESLQPLATAEELLNWVNKVQELNQEMHQSMRQVLAEMQEENRQAGKKRDEFLRTLSDMEQRFRRDGEDMLNTFRLWTPMTFIGAAAVSTVFSILMRILLR